MSARSKLTRDEQRATAFYSKGPYTAHNAITCAVIEGPDHKHVQTTSTILGAHRLAELLNHVDRVVNEYTHEICPNTQIDTKEIVAAAVARALGWRLEAATDRRERLKRDANEAIA